MNILLAKFSFGSSCSGILSKGKKKEKMIKSGHGVVDNEAVVEKSSGHGVVSERAVLKKRG